VAEGGVETALEEGPWGMDWLGASTVIYAESGARKLEGAGVDGS
jgi:hypothetical protein